jgi:acetoacetyl-CoA synthetase
MLWSPTAADVENANATRFMQRTGHATWDELYRWSVDDLEGFWRAVWDFYEVRTSALPSAVLDGEMPGARFFTGARLNYAEHVLARAPASGPAILACAERGEPVEITRTQLRGQVGALAAALRERGVGEGDRVAAYVGNVPAAVVAMLATTSIGAVWAACAPDFGTQSVIDRFAQLEPTVLFAVEAYEFGGRTHDRRAVVRELEAALPTVRSTIRLGRELEAITAVPQEPEFAQVDFDHPLWVLFSSGTTGIPKGIVQGHGGILLEHLKSLGLCLDLGPDDRYLFHSSTSWMAWNFLVGGLLHGATIVTYDGSPGFPSTDALWTLAARTGATVLGMGAAYAAACAKAGVRLRGLERLRTAIPTGSPLAPAGWEWLARELPGRTRIDALCGGTDVCTVFFGGSPLQPVRSGEISGRWLGVRAEAWDAAGSALTGEVGEFVVTAPMPSMPLRLWNDPGGERLRDAYFSTYPGVWRQGDWIAIGEDGGVRVMGRSDATLNKAGVRMGSAEIYGVVERFPEVADSLIVGVEEDDGGYYMPLFVVAELDDALRDRIVAALRAELSPRHVPSEIVAAPAIPRTITGKKLEVPVKRLLAGADVTQAAAAGTVDRPDALDWFAAYATSRLTA